MGERRESGCGAAMFVILVALVMVTAITGPRFRRLEERVEALESALAVVEAERKERE